MNFSNVYDWRAFKDISMESHRFRMCFSKSKIVVSCLMYDSLEQHDSHHCTICQLNGTVYTTNSPSSEKLALIHKTITFDQLQKYLTLSI